MNLQSLLPSANWFFHCKCQIKKKKNTLLSISYHKLVLSNTFLKMIWGHTKIQLSIIDSTYNVLISSLCFGLQITIYKWDWAVNEPGRWKLRLLHRSHVSMLDFQLPNCLALKWFRRHRFYVLFALYHQGKQMAEFYDLNLLHAI